MKIKYEVRYLFGWFVFGQVTIDGPSICCYKDYCESWHIRKNNIQSEYKILKRLGYKEQLKLASHLSRITL